MHHRGASPSKGIENSVVGGHNSVGVRGGGVNGLPVFKERVGLLEFKKWPANQLGPYHAR